MRIHSFFSQRSFRNLHFQRVAPRIAHVGTANPPVKTNFVTASRANRGIVYFLAKV